MNVAPLEERLADPMRRNHALEELEQIAGAKTVTSPRVLAQLSLIIKEPGSVGDVRKFASLLVDCAAEGFVLPLVEMIGGDPKCESGYTLSYMYALGRLLDQSVCEHPAEFFSPSFIAQLGHWLCNTEGGELSWKAGIILEHIRVPQAFELMRRGAADASLFFQTRIHCVSGLVNGLGTSELPFLTSLASPSEPRFDEALADAIAWLKKQPS